jgi:hypothetical protein
LKKAHASLLGEMVRLTKARDGAERAVKAAERAEAADRKAVEGATGDARQRSEKSFVANTAKRVAAEVRLRDAIATLTSKRAANAAVLRRVDDADADAKSTWEAYRRFVRVGEPVSVLISGKTGMLYVRQAFDPIFEVRVAIADHSGPLLGTHVFTLMDKATEAAGSAPARWSVVSMPQLPGEPRTWHVADVPPTAWPDATALQALDRIAMPADVRARIEAVLVPGSSLIVTDEAPSAETGKGTDFVIELNQPQPEGAIVRDARRVDRPVGVATVPSRPSIPVEAAGSTSAFDVSKAFASDR